MAIDPEADLDQPSSHYLVNFDAQCLCQLLSLGVLQTDQILNKDIDITDLRLFDCPDCPCSGKNRASLPPLVAVTDRGMRLYLACLSMSAEMSSNIVLAPLRMLLESSLCVVSLRIDPEIWFRFRS